MQPLAVEQPLEIPHVSVNQSSNGTHSGLKLSSHVVEPRDAVIVTLQKGDAPPAGYISTSFDESKDPERLAILQSTFDALISNHFESERFTSGFWQRASSERSRVQGIWEERRRTGVWVYDELNITQCLVLYPECVFGFHPHSASARLVRKCCVEHARLRELLAFTEEVAAAARIEVWHGWGNLLGIVRHGGVLMPWDTDLDMVVASADKDRLRDAVNAAVKAKREAIASAAGGGAVSEPAMRAADPATQYAITKDRRRDMQSVWLRARANPMDSHVEVWAWREDERGGTIDDQNAKAARRVPRSDVWPLARCAIWGVAGLCPRDSVKVVAVRDLVVCVSMGSWVRSPLGALSLTVCVFAFVCVSMRVCISIWVALWAHTWRLIVCLVGAYVDCVIPLCDLRLLLLLRRVRVPPPHRRTSTGPSGAIITSRARSTA